MTIEEKVKTEVAGKYDVVVCGGGPGGLTAAIAAARNGCRTLLIEKNGYFGGLATAGLMGPFFGYAKPGGDLILGGIPIEIVRELQKAGGAQSDKEILSQRDGWGAIKFIPEIFKHVADDMIVKAGVNILFHSYICNVICDKSRIRCVVVENKSGRQAFEARIFIDATGDGDVAYLAGAEYTKGRQADGNTQAMGTKFIIGGKRPTTPEENQSGVKFVEEAMAKGGLTPQCHPFWGEPSEDGITWRPGEHSPTVTRCKGDGTNVNDLTRAELKVRKDTLAIIEFYKKNVPGFENCYLIQTPAEIGVRETRQVTGVEVLKKEDILGRKRKDAIARGWWIYDIHCPLGRVGAPWTLCSWDCNIKPDCIMKTKYKKQLLEHTFLPEEVDYYDIPYGCLTPKKLDNLLVSGRCISADHYAMSSARVIGTCFAIGEACGTAAALCIKSNIFPKEVNISELRNKLIEAGAVL